MSLIDNMFNNLSRIGLDECDKTNKQISNIKSSEYMLENYSVYNSLSSANNLAQNQPNIFINGSPNGGISANVIDDNSKLKLSEITKNRERDEGNHKRLFTTIPYLGNGPYDVVSDNDLKLPILNTNRKTENPNTEVSQDNYIYYPLIPSIESTISNPENLVEGAANPDWIRGGLPSRLYNRISDTPQ